MKNDALDIQAKEIIRSGGKAGRQESHRNALIALNQAFENNFVEAVTLALNLNEAQAKKFAIRKTVFVFLKHTESIIWQLMGHKLLRYWHK